MNPALQNYPNGGIDPTLQNRRTGRFQYSIRLVGIFLRSYIPSMTWIVEYTDEFGRWWDGLTEDEQEDVAAAVALLEARGPQLPYPYSSGIEESRHAHMRELRIQHRGRPIRVLYAFDPRRVAILLVGGDKTGDDRWYRKSVPLADRLYDDHLRTLAKEAGEDG